MIKIKIEDIKNIDTKYSYFHYTNKSNLEGIKKKGLIPLIGESSNGIEKTKKIFFTVGSDYFLILLDIWIKWLLAKGVIDLPGKKMDYPAYYFFAKIIKLKFFPKFLVNLVVKLELNTPIVRKKVFKQFEEIMDNSVLLKLDLENKVDFDFTDKDEVKYQNYDKRLLQMIYNKNDDVYDVQMEYWNMHTKTDKTIEKEKITLLNIDGNFKLKYIVEYFKKNTGLKLKHSCPYLYSYYKWIEKREKSKEPKQF